MCYRNRQVVFLRNLIVKSTALLVAVVVYHLQKLLVFPAQGQEERNMARIKTRVHNEWFRTVSMGMRKSCPSCHSKLKGEAIWSWGEYHNGKWRTVKHFCRGCFPIEVAVPLKQHNSECGCNISLVGKSTTLPEWLTIS